MRRVLQRLTRGLWHGFAGLVVLLAIVVLAARASLPLLDSHPDVVAGWLGSYLQRDVEVASVETQWQPDGPLLVVSGLRIGSGAQALVLPRARLKLDLLAALGPRRALELRISNVNAQLVADATGQWHLSGLKLGDQGNRAPLRLPSDLPLGLVLRDLTVHVSHAGHELDFAVHAPTVRVVMAAGRLRIGGEIGLPGGRQRLHLVAAIDPTRRSGELYLAGEQMDLSTWARVLSPQRDLHGQGQLRLWLGWTGGDVDHLVADIDFRDVRAGRSGEIPVGRLDGMLRLEGSRSEWHARWQPATSGGATGRVDVAHAPSGRWQVQAEAVDLAQLSPWLTLLGDNIPAVPQALVDMHAHGMIDELAVAWHDARHFALRARFTGVGWQAAHGLPQVDHLDGVLRGDGKALSLHLPSQPATIALPGVFREPFVLDKVSGDISFWRLPHGWQLVSDNLAVAAPGYSARVRGGLVGRDNRELPVLDVAVRVTRAKVSATGLFLPVNVMPTDAVDWLDQSLVSGKVQGRAVFRGNLADWPFPQHEGWFQAVGDFRDAVLDYDPDWPRATHLQGIAHFVNDGMQIDATAGRSMGNDIAAGKASIADLANGLLELDIRGAGNNAQLLQWLKATPVVATHTDALAQIRLGGRSAYHVILDLPVGDPQAQFNLDGTVDLEKASFEAPAWSFALDNLAGELHFGPDGVQARELAARYHGDPVRLALAIGEVAGNAGVRADLRGKLTGATLAQTYSGLEGLRDVVQGTAAFHASLKLGGDGPGRLQLESNLEGMRLALPAPLDKPAVARVPLQLRLDLPAAGGKLALRLGDTLDAQLRLPDDKRPLAADIALGEAATAPDAGIAVHGEAATLDIGGWLAQLAVLAPASASGTDLAQTRVDLTTAQARVGDTTLGPLAIKLQSGDDGLHLALDGQALAGQIDLPLASLARRGVRVRMDRLHWPASQGDAQGPAAPALVAPAAVPPLHVWVKDLRLGDVELGNVRLETVPMSDGMRISHFGARSKVMQIDGRGRWLGTRANSHSRFAIDLSSGDFGQMLGAFGHPDLVAGGSSLLHIEGQWPGSPLAFSLAELDGTIALQVEDGRILSLDPGLGRFFGLFSIRELPRRLSLDFGDVFRSGYSFNSIKGTIRFADGNARSNKLTLLGPAADIVIDGRVGLQQRDYDEVVTVTPHVGTALPVVGALAGGPVGAAAGLALQGLLGKDMNRSSAVRYHVTGSWDEPVIQRTDDQASVVPFPARTHATTPKPEPAPTPRPELRKLPRTRPPLPLPASARSVRLPPMP